MDTIRLAGTTRETTRLGFGGSSLMGALGRRESLALLESAYDAGIRHFDVAPMYGYGAAEGCLGEFLARHPGQLTVTTKYGIPPAKNQGLMSLARRVAGPIVKRVPALKSRLARAASSVAAPTERASFTAAQARASLDRSLLELKTDHIDVWLLHDVQADDLTDPELLRLLEDSVAAGKLGTFGAGTDADKIPALLATQPGYCRVLQSEWSVLDATPATTAAFRIHHRALTDKFRSLHSALTSAQDLCRRWSEEVGVDLADRDTLAHLMLKASLVANPQSIILFSSKSAKHMRDNVHVADDASLAVPASRLHALVQREGIPAVAVAA